MFKNRTLQHRSREESANTHHAPIVVDLLERDWVEDDAGHDLGEDGPVLDEVIVVLDRLLVDDWHDPLENLVLQLQVPLQQRSELKISTLQMKGRWLSNINVWFPFMYS